MIAHSVGYRKRPIHWTSECEKSENVKKSIKAVREIQKICRRMSQSTRLKNFSQPCASQLYWFIERVSCCLAHVFFLYSTRFLHRTDWTQLYSAKETFVHVTEIGRLCCRMVSSVKFIDTVFVVKVSCIGLQYVKVETCTNLYQIWNFWHKKLPQVFLYKFLMQDSWACVRDIRYHRRMIGLIGLCAIVRVLTVGVKQRLDSLSLSDNAGWSKT